MRTSITRLIIAAAVATVTASGTPVARSLAAPPVPPLPNRYEPPFSETDFHLGDHQQLRGYFLDGSQDRLR